MQKIRNWLSKFHPRNLRVFLALGFTTFGFIIFSLATIRDLLAPRDYREFIVNPIPLALSAIGIIAVVLALRDKIRIGSYLLITAVIIGFLLIAIFTTESTYSTISELLIIVIPVMIAIQSFSEREFTWIVIVTIVARSAIQILGTFKSSGQLSGASAQTAVIAQWLSVVIAILFGLYLAINLNNYAFRVKLILVLGLLTIIPTALLTSISRRDLENNLLGQANQSLVLSSDQIASAVDQFVQTTLDTTRTESQIPTLEDYIGQAPISLTGGQGVFARGTEIEKATLYSLYSIMKKDPFNIIACRLIDRVGRIQLSTNPDEVNKFASNQDFHLIPIQKGLPYMTPVTFSENGQGTIHFSAPIRTSAGVTNGVLDIIYSASIFQQIIIRNGDKLGEGISAMLLDENKIILAHSTSSDLIFKIVNPADNNTIDNLIYTGRLQNLQPKQLSVQMNGLTQGVDNFSKLQFFTGNFTPAQTTATSANTYLDQAGIAHLSSQNWYLVTFVPQQTLLAPVQKQIQSVVFVSILISLVSIAIALGLTQVLIAPILRLTRTSEQIKQGDINAIASISTRDEIGELASSFNAMTGRVRELIGSLEQRVADRTQALQHRAIQLQAAADVGSTIARLRDLNELLPQVTRLISQRFGYYHIGIFLLDDRGEYAVLRATNSDGGQRMLLRGHKLKVGQVGIVGNVTSSGQPRIVLNVGEDTAFFNNPDLPETQSEMAIPLIVGGRILGALDIQSKQEAAFTDEDIATLKVLADQLAIAIENARLFTENQIALETAQRAYGMDSTEGWQKLLRDELNNLGFVSVAENQAFSVSEGLNPAFSKAIETGQYVLEENNTVLHLPIKIRGQSVGALRMVRSLENGGWTPETIGMADTLSVQLGAALESARLYSDIRKRADRERTVSEITTRVRSTTDPNEMLETALEELKHALGAKDIRIRPYSATQVVQGDEERHPSTNDTLQMPPEPN